VSVFSILILLETRLESNELKFYLLIKLNPKRTESPKVQNHKTRALPYSTSKQNPKNLPELSEDQSKGGAGLWFVEGSALFGGNMLKPQASELPKLANENRENTQRASERRIGVTVSGPRCHPARVRVKVRADPTAFDARSA
jgi:hypothetical protein